MKAFLTIALGFMAIIAGNVSAQTSGANGTHDPSRMIECNGKVYVYSTGGGSKYSTDGLVWTNGTRLFSDIPSTTTSIVSNNEGVWAPDGIFYKNQYYMFYSIANAENACAIGCLTSPTLDPNAANFKWTDHGAVISNPNATYCTIDPCPFVDANGDLWLSWGSGYSKKSTDQTIYVTRLDNTTGLRSTVDTAFPGHPLEPGHIEASYVYYHSPYYYLFWNSGGCCNGASSTYTIHLARSKVVTGPYTDEKPKWYTSNGSIHGPGQIGIYDQCGYSRFTYHYYPDNGGSVLGENELTWSSDGWPVVGAVCKTPMKLCGVVGNIIGTTHSGVGSQVVARFSGVGKGNLLIIQNTSASCMVEVTTVAGRIVMQKYLPASAAEYSIPLTSVARGAYLVRITTSEGIINGKLALMK